jgi:hypothetical protein
MATSWFFRKCRLLTQKFDLVLVTTLYANTGMEFLPVPTA